MNVPGSAGGNWGWRCTEAMLTNEPLARLRDSTATSNRLTGQVHAISGPTDDCAHSLAALRKPEHSLRIRCGPGLHCVRGLNLGCNLIPHSFGAALRRRRRTQFATTYTTFEATWDRAYSWRWRASALNLRMPSASFSVAMA